MKSKDPARRLPAITLAVIALLMLLITANINWGKNHWNQIVRSDGEGNYAYLPAVFIHHDLNFKFFDYYEGVKYHDPFNFRDYRMVVDGKFINKTWCGAALAMSPFYLVAHAYAGLAGYEQDGFSKPYPISVTFAALFYLMLGLWALNRILKTFDHPPLIRSLLLIALLFGTNLFYYTVGEPSMNHVFSFGLVSLFFYLLRSYFIKPSGKLMLGAGLVLGVVMLIRPMNGLIILSMPVAAGSYVAFKMGLRAAFQKPMAVIAVVILAGGVLFIQMIIYKISCGYFFIYSYGNERFNFLQPHMIDFLFSYKKGMFLYTPLTLLALCGFWWLWKQNRFSFFSLLFLVYVFSSWWSWWYGGSFSSRIMTDQLVFFGLLLGFAFMQLKTKWMRTVMVVLIILIVAFCQIQTFQYRYHKIHWSDMNKEMYWDVFLRIDRL
jgi:hypothetical protein